MSDSGKNINTSEELTWVIYKEENDQTFLSKVKSKGIFGILVPLGCLGTCGVLGTGLYYMFKRNSKKQQVFMRFRVLAQGLTLCFATMGILTWKTS